MTTINLRVIVFKTSPMYVSDQVSYEDGFLMSLVESHSNIKKSNKLSLITDISFPERFKFQPPSTNCLLIASH